MTQNGKFILFNLSEFGQWLNGLHLNRKIKIVQNHHTWLPDYSTFNKKKSDRYFSLLRSMEASHIERGFSEIAQNITTFPDGMIAICRNLETIPAGIKGANLNGICIEHIGNFDSGKDVMTPEHRNTIIRVNAMLCQKFKLTPGPNSVVYHHWFDLVTGKRVKEGAGSTKTCPGTNFFNGNSVEKYTEHFLPKITAQMQRIS